MGYSNYTADKNTVIRFADEVLGHVNDSFSDDFEIQSAFISNGVAEVEIRNKDFGEFYSSIEIDDNGDISSSVSKWALQVASDLIRQIKDANTQVDLEESMSDEEFNDKYFPRVDLTNTERFDYYKYGNKDFAYDRKNNVVIYLFKDPDEGDNAPWRELDAVGLRAENWENNEVRDEYLFVYVDDLDAEAMYSADEFIGEKLLSETSNKQLDSKKKTFYARMRDKHGNDFRGKFDDDDKLANEELFLIDMLHSIFAYAPDTHHMTVDDIMQNRYIKQYIETLGVDRVREIASEELNDFKSHARVRKDVFQDSEGLSYNSIEWDDELTERYWIDNKEVMEKVDDLGEQLIADGWNLLGDKYSGSKYYEFYGQRGPQGKGIFKAICYDYEGAYVRDITYEQYIGREPIDGFVSFRRKLGKMLLPRRDGMNESTLQRNFMLVDNKIQYVNVQNQYNYTIQEIRIDNENKTFERGNFSIGHDKAYKNRQVYEDFIDNLKEMGYTEIPSDYKSLRNKSRNGIPTSI